MIDRRLLTNFDWKLLLLIICIAAVGILNIYSATASYKMAGTPYAVKQLYWIAVALFLAVLTCSIDYHILEDVAYWVYGAVAILLLVVLVIGRSSMGATRWLHLGFFSIQPSEPMKIVIIMAFARYFNRHPVFQGLRLRDLAIPLLLLGGPAILIMKQPDLGTAIMVTLMVCSILFYVGVRWSTVATVVLALLT